ncbi:MAG TPA: Asp-tRNA(Asn)/Glu-tRNA(Gln) amidotransferase subunit GatA [Deltaproteobacteria bacterium]|nr:Asp-tRNA(Asn)/Glu-tRNA(Gln) amidotransferase subunit GatA [Deltaproteobacteria bacterium]
MLAKARAFRRNDLSPVEAAKDILAAIEASDLNAYITVDREGALRQAEEASRRLDAGDDDPLLGLTIAVKDNICTKGVRTTCASRMLAEFVPPYEAHVVELLRGHGAVIVGKTNMDEFAMGSTTSTGAFGCARNPWDTSRTPGGSSGGSAASVVAGLCDAALGSDTGGSIRQPASFCGITGLKPTYGAVSRYGLVAFASSLDQIGPMTRSARDAAVLFDAIRGHDPRDSTSVDHACRPLPLHGSDIRGLTIGVPEEFFGEGLDRDVERSVRHALGIFEDLGARIVPLSLPNLRYCVAVYYLIAPAEASSNLARYDGVRYGTRRGDEEGLFEMYSATRSAGFGDEVKRRIMLGTYALSAGYYDAYYLKASRVRTLIVQDLEAAFTHCDLIAGPTVPVTAFGLDEMPGDPLSLYLLDIYTIPANLAGIPAMSIPCGFDERGLPIGLQLMAGAFREDLLLGAAITFQDHTRFHEVRP